MSRKDQSAAVEELLSQAKDLHVLEQVAKINLSGFTDDSVLPSHLETRFRRLKSLPASSSSTNLLTHSKSFRSFPDTKNRGSLSASSRNLQEKSRPFNIPIVRSRSELGETSTLRRIGSSSSRFSRSGRRDFSVSGRIYSNSSRFSQEVRTTQPQKLLSERKSNFSSSSLRSSASTSPSSHKDQKSKAKLLISWFDKLSLARVMGCLRRSPEISSPNSKRKELQRKEELRKSENISRKNSAVNKRAADPKKSKGKEIEI